MEIEAWLNESGDVVAASDLASPAAAALVRFVERHGVDLVTFVEARHGARGDLVVLDFRTGRPQQSAYPIKRIERIGVCFANVDAMPFVYILRPDFPDTLHQQLTIEGSPRAICIDDRSWAEARLTWTPAELVHRILTWFSRAARGELHDARQPIEPFLMGSPLSLIIARDVLDRAGELDLVAVHEVENRQMLRVVPVQEVDGPLERAEPLCLVAYRIPPESMQRLAFAPRNLGSLAAMLEQRGIALLDDLRLRFQAWLDAKETSAWRFHARFAVVVEMPIVGPDGALQDGTDLRAFITDRSAGAIAVALGVAMAAGPEEGSRLGYVRPLLAALVDEEAVRAVEVQSAEIHYEFDRRLATQLSGRSQTDERNAVLVGAGAIGSQVADCLAREGRFHWTVVDPDRLLPHNIARHIGRGRDVTRRKACLVEAAISETIRSASPIAAAIAADVTTDGPERDDIDRALLQADMVIDATASVVAARYLADHAAAARRASIFYNPAGDAVVLLAEPANRSLTLRDLEAQYLGLIAREARLAGHLAASAGAYAYTGACRAITNRMSQSRAMALSGLVSDGLGKAVDQDAGVIKVWQLSDAGSVEVHEIVPAPVEHFGAGEWRVSIDRGLVGRIRDMRGERLPDETGGVLTGVVDIPARRLHLVDAAPAPADSAGSRNGFTRGTAGVQDHLDRLFERTGGHLRYVGEWHSHPPRAGTHPSATDLAQIDWLATLLDMDTLPALMLIAGDRDLSIVLANRPAVPVVDDRALGRAGGRRL